MENMKGIEPEDTASYSPGSNEGDASMYMYMEKEGEQVTVD
jgi:hypothetical protein